MWHCPLSFKNRSYACLKVNLIKLSSFVDILPSKWPKKRLILRQVYVVVVQSSTLLRSLSVLGQLGRNETGQRSLLSSLTKLEIACQCLAHGWNDTNSTLAKTPNSYFCPQPPLNYLFAVHSLTLIHKKRVCPFKVVIVLLQAVAF